jgi:zinc protease
MPGHPKISPGYHLLDALWREQVERTVLPNGTTVILKADPSAALASVQVWVKTGSMHEGPFAGAGLSHFLEHMLFKGTARRTGPQISETVQAHGGYINAYTTFDRTVYHIDLPSEHLETAVDVLADAVLHSTIPAEEVARERDVILREISMTRDDPDTRLWEALFSTAFREHPYRLPIIGHRDIFAAVSRDDLVQYYRTRYVPENLVVVAVGDFEPAAARAAVERHFSGVPRSRLVPAPVAPEPIQLAPREAHRFEDVELTRAVLSWPIPGLAHPDAPVLDLLSILLGNGDSSVLWSEIREKAGLVHEIQSTSWNPGTTGLFCISLTCEAAKREAATEAVGHALKRRALRGFTAEQLAKALRQLVVGEVNARKTMSGQASRLGAAEVVVGDLDYSRVYFERVRTVRTADLRRVLRAYLVPSRRTAVSINPASAPGSAAARAPAPRAGSGRAPRFTETVLPNGARILLRTDRRLPNLHLRALMRGGAMFEESGRRGSTALLSAMLTKDTRRRTAAGVARYIEEVGGSFYPFSGNNSLGICAEVLASDLGRAVEVVREGLLEPAFKPATFGQERDAQLAGLQEDQDDVVTLARKLVRRKFFGSHPMALDPQGDREGVGALTPGNLAALHRRLCTAPNVVLAACGDFDPEKLQAQLTTLLLGLPDGPRRAAQGALPAPPTGPAGDYVEFRACEQAVVLQAYPSPPLHAPDYYAGEVADELFSGMASRLFERVRGERGLAYFVRSERVVGSETGMFCFVAGTEPGREKDVQSEVDAEIERVQAGRVGEEELGRCRERLKAAWRQQSQTNSARAFRAGLDALQGRPVNDSDRYDGRIEAVSGADVQAFAKRYFRPALRVTLVVRPHGK